MLSQVIREYATEEWNRDVPAGDGLEAQLEAGRLLFFPRLRFAVGAHEEKFLSERWSDGKAKNISLRGRGETAALRGCQGSAEDLAVLGRMLERFAQCAEGLARQLFPVYRGRLTRGFTSFRPHAVTGRQTSWRKDDTRLHVDAFPSNPTGGLRLLRVFSNVNPGDVPRVWRVGEPFENLAQRFLPKVGRYSAASARLMKTLGLTKSLRTEYDHIMLQLHDLGKCDVDYQRRSPQRTCAFPPGSTWVVYSDQVQHAVSSGQFLLEQTFYLEAEDLEDPSSAPVHVLERLTGRVLI